jgi:hypothetical protein
MEYLRPLGDGLSIAALALIWAATRGAWKRIGPDVRVPLDARGAKRVSRTFGLLFIPIAATVLLLAPTLSGMAHTVQGQDALFLFCLRAFLAAIFGVTQLTYLKMVVTRLDAEGALDR